MCALQTSIEEIVNRNGSICSRSHIWYEYKLLNESGLIKNGNIIYQNRVEIVPCTNYQRFVGMATIISIGISINFQSKTFKCFIIVAIFLHSWAFIVLSSGKNVPCWSPSWAWSSVLSKQVVETNIEWIRSGQSKHRFARLKVMMLILFGCCVWSWILEWSWYIFVASIFSLPTCVTD